MIVIRGVPNILEDRLKCMFMPLGSILLEGSVSMNLFAPMRHQVDLRKAEVSF